MDEQHKDCPLTGKTCNPQHCMWYDHIYKQCAVSTIAESLATMDDTVNAMMLYLRQENY